MRSRGMVELECIFGRYEAEIDRLQAENDRLRKELDEWVGLAMKGQAVHERATLDLILSGALDRKVTT